MLPCLERLWFSQAKCHHKSQPAINVGLSRRTLGCCAGRRGSAALTATAVRSAGEMPLGGRVLPVNPNKSKAAAALFEIASHPSPLQRQPSAMVRQPSIASEPIASSSAEQQVMLSDCSRSESWNQSIMYRAAWDVGSPRCYLFDIVTDYKENH